MAEEEKKEKVQSQPDPDSSGGEKTADSTKEKDQTEGGENWEQKFKDAQSEATQHSQKTAELQEQLDTITPFVDFSRVQGGEPAKSAEEDEEKFISEKDAQKLFTNVRNEVSGQLMAMQFKSKNPDLIEYEKSIVTPAVIRLAKEHPTWNRDKLLEEAVKFTKDLLGSVRKEGEEKVEQKDKAAGAASGLGSAGPTPPKKGDKGGQSYDDYITDRKAVSNKGRGIG